MMIFSLGRFVSSDGVIKSTLRNEFLLFCQLCLKPLQIENPLICDGTLLNFIKTKHPMEGFTTKHLSWKT
jgi:hypothetical protein